MHRTTHKKGEFRLYLGLLVSLAVASASVVAFAFHVEVFGVALGSTKAELRGVFKSS